ncbi:hypothetical protein [Thiocapsa roseopersicina]|nr:hypothetical protein [Thiocapsa roseopersicina]
MIGGTKKFSGAASTTDPAGRAERKQVMIQKEDEHLDERVGWVER